MTSQWNARFADLICGLLHPGPLSLQKSKEDSFALMYTVYTYSTYSIVTFYNIIQHQSLSTVCLTLIRSLSPFSRSPTRQRVESPPPPPASSCWPLNLAIQIYPWRSKQVRDVGWQGYDGICVFSYGVYIHVVSHILEPRLEPRPNMARPDQQPSAQRPGRPKDLTEKDGGVWLGSAWTDDIGWVCKDASKGSPQEPFVKYQTCVQRTPCAMRMPCCPTPQLFKRSNSPMRLEL